MLYWTPDSHGRHTYREKVREKAVKWTMAFKPGMMMNEARRLYNAVALHTPLTYGSVPKNRRILREATQGAPLYRCALCSRVLVYIATAAEIIPDDLFSYIGSRVSRLLCTLPQEPRMVINLLSYQSTIVIKY